MDIKRTDEKLIKDIEEWNKQEKCIIDDGRTEREKYLEQRCEELENKITNLQEELKSANESITWWSNRFKAVERDKKDYKSRNEKAIEYIEHENFKRTLLGFSENKYLKNIQKDLLNILNGGDE